MRCVILAAGQGTRLLPHTADRPKCLVRLAGRPLLARQLDVLRRVGVEEVTVVGGYLGSQLRAFAPQVLLNPEFATTNMVASLMCAAALLDGGDDVLVTYGDIVYEPRVAHALLASTASLATTIDIEWRRLWEMRSDDLLADAETLRLDKAGNVVELGERPFSLADIEGQYMGLLRIGATLAPRLVDAYRELRAADAARAGAMYMTAFLQHLIASGHTLQAVPVSGGWLEVDSTRDLETYEMLARTGRLADLCDLDSTP